MAVVAVVVVVVVVAVSTVSSITSITSVSMSKERLGRSLGSRYQRFLLSLWRFILVT